MLFNSLQYALFLPIVFAVYWILPHRFRWIVLLISSYYFYMCSGVKYIVLILFVTVLSYVCAGLIAATNDKKKKRYFMILCILGSLALLFVFKYWNFTIASIDQIAAVLSIQLHPMTLKLMLPVGISFYTFQAISYVTDIYRGKVEPERHFGIYAAFISFFPQLVAGPIERTGNLLPQIKSEHRFDYSQGSYGLKLMAWGYFKKIVIADTFSVYADKVFNDVNAYSGFSLLLASLIFTLQIYCDFSGYSDIAIGTANLFGIKLMKNFDAPYFARSVREFWRRWHISLSTWFRDYVYIPLGGNRNGHLRQNINVMITFLLSGLWHGAAWHFVMWGGIHGIAQLLETSIERAHNKDKSKGKGDAPGLIGILKICLVFSFVSFAWIFFRTDVENSFYVISHMFNGIGRPLSYVKTGLAQIGLSNRMMVKMMGIVAALTIYDLYSLKCDMIDCVTSWKWYLRWPLYYAVGFCVLYFGARASSTAFIYFQF